MKGIRCIQIEAKRQETKGLFNQRDAPHSMLCVGASAGNIFIFKMNLRETNRVTSYDVNALTSCAKLTLFMSKWKVSRRLAYRVL